MRSAVAKQSGLNEELADKAFSDPTSLPQHQQAAIALADALMTQPGQIEKPLADELSAHFSQAQIVELTLDVMKWNYQKVAVASGTDFELRPGELADLHFDDDGHFIRPT